ncbi:peroxiredoxin family protein [Desulfolutivibrio sulfoxidireducens]|uniref:peroxiredoxin family protein n=1 Tax=Desulfolutivibrio sulfoxidireducens TaxID=2773299 RepID=UPI00159D0A32|nr:TlpA disulfide reductase family protein [Desulfolutivibrio sulfoxidireducens]QLA16498.1 redoxin family protein [Desulfolutivibrio sulfoxidireducens]QLA19624.1 redoxin family protein [Desulfolutivibrio sulfoxidireducens]
MIQALLRGTLVAVCLFMAEGGASSSPAGEPPREGDVLPDFTLVSPESPEDRTALGLSDAATFKLGDVDASCLLFEVIGVYCPECHKQAPLFGKLHARLAKDQNLSGRVKMLAMAAGATTKELEYLLKRGEYPFCVVNDPEYVAHKALGEPKTPFTMIVDRQGRVLFVHLGVITDMGGFFRTIENLCR